MTIRLPLCILSRVSRYVAILYRHLGFWRYIVHEFGYRDTNHRVMYVEENRQKYLGMWYRLNSSWKLSPKYLIHLEMHHSQDKISEDTRVISRYWKFRINVDILKIVSIAIRSAPVCLKMAPYCGELKIYTATIDKVMVQSQCCAKAPNADALQTWSKRSTCCPTVLGPSNLVGCRTSSLLLQMYECCTKQR